MPSMKPLCSARRRMTYNGRKFTAKCTRFDGHVDHPSGKYKDHFDHRRRISWKSTPNRGPKLTEISPEIIDFYTEAYLKAQEPRPKPTIRTHATRTHPMPQKLLYSDVKARAQAIIAEWEAENNDEKTHSQIDKLQIEVLHTIATAPAGAALGPLQAMAAEVMSLEVEGLNFRKWSA